MKWVVLISLLLVCACVFGEEEKHDAIKKETKLDEIELTEPQKDSSSEHGDQQKEMLDHLEKDTAAGIENVKKDHTMYVPYPRCKSFIFVFSRFVDHLCVKHLGRGSIFSNFLLLKQKLLIRSLFLNSRICMNGAYISRSLVF